MTSWTILIVAPRQNSVGVVVCSSISYSGPSGRPHLDTYNMRTPFYVLFVSLIAVPFVQANNKNVMKAPNFTSDAQWIDVGEAGNKVPHSIKGYRGHVLLIDFWEYTCINCIREFRTLKRWYSKYHGDGLTLLECTTANSRLDTTPTTSERRRSAFFCLGR